MGSGPNHRSEFTRNQPLIRSQCVWHASCIWSGHNSVKGYLCSVFLMVAPTLVADTNAVRLLTLSQCVVGAVEHNFDVKIEKQNLAIARNQLNRAYGEFDPRLRMEA